MIAWPKILGGVLVLAAITWTILEIRADGARSITNAFERQNNAAAHSAGDAMTLALTACGTSAPASVDGLRWVVGTDLVGARGATPADQRKIDRTVVGLCAGGVWTNAECVRHGEAAR